MHSLQLLGGGALYGPGGAPVSGGAAQPRRTAVLALIADAHPGMIAREKVVGILWPERPPRKARRLLTQALYELKKELGPDVLLTAGGAGLALNPKRVDVDLIRFRRALRDDDPIGAVQEYGGLALDGFFVQGAPTFEEWTERLRTRTSRGFQGALENLAERAEERNRMGGAVRWRRRLVEEKPYDANAVERLMEALLAAGNRAAALEAAEAYERRMREELELEPNPRVRALAARMLAPPGLPAELKRADPPSPDPEPPTEASSAAERRLLAGPAGQLKGGWRTGRSRLLLAGVAGFAVLFLVAYGLLADGPPDPDAEAGPPTLAVLPFEYRTGDRGYAYVADGLHEELITQLAKVEALRVISRTSVLRYRDAGDPIHRIAEELGVEAVVEGSIQVAESRLRVNVRLTDAATDQHLWGERYDGTLDDALGIQSDIARSVASAVGATLAADESVALSATPTENAEAYRLYLQGRRYHSRPGYLRRNLEAAGELYEAALSHDPEFALAHAALSEVHGNLHWFRYDPSPERTELQKKAADAALRLHPGLPEGHLALGLWHYWSRRDYRRALEEFDLALDGMPNDARLWTWIGYVHRRLGNWSRVEAAFERAAELDPLDANLFNDLGGNMFAVTRRYREAVAAYDRALRIAPDLHAAAVEKGWTYARWQGRTDTLRAVLRKLPPGAQLSWLGGPEAQRALLFLWEHRPDSLLAVVQEARTPVLEGQIFYLPTSLVAAWAHRLRGDEDSERRELTASLHFLDSTLVELPDDWRVRAARGLTLAGLGRTTAALREAEWLRQAPVYRLDALQGPLAAEERARILARIGKSEDALEEIERLLTGGSLLTVHSLRLDPRWDPLREHPDFRELLARHASPHRR